MSLNIEAAGIDEEDDEVLFEKSLLFEMLKKDPQSRTENDMKELRQILMNVDFIKNNDCNLLPQDLNDMVKHA